MSAVDLSIIVAVRNQLPHNRLFLETLKAAGTVRTDVAVGTVRLSSIRRATTALAPRSGVIRASGALAGAGIAPRRGR